MRWVQATATLAILVFPLAVVVAAAVLLWGRLFTLTDLLLTVGLYAITGFGVAVGFHRGFTHRSFEATYPLKVALAVAGSMAFQGTLTSWVAAHRRHHAFTDEPGDPHSPHRFGHGAWAQVRGIVHAHVGWLFIDDPTAEERYAPDLLADRTMRTISRLFPMFCVASLAVPFALGWVITGSLLGGVTAFVWAGAVRVALLQHVTWSVNSLCHMFGERPHATRRFDRSTDLWPLALLSFGDSWHNGHHSAPSLARHGRRRGQFDIGAVLIRFFEQLGWATNVKREAKPTRVEAKTSPKS